MKCPNCGAGETRRMDWSDNAGVYFACGAAHDLRWAPGKYLWRDKPTVLGKIQYKCPHGPLPENSQILFDQMFTDGEQVVVVCGEDELHWGTMCATAHGVELTRPGRKPTFLWWEDVTLIAHDGFPVRKLTGAAGSKRALKLDTTKPGDAIRTALDARRTPVRNIRFGDPFDIEDVTAEIVNAGNWQWADFYADEEEGIVMTAPDGARGILGGLYSVIAHDFHPNPPELELV